MNCHATSSDVPEKSPTAASTGGAGLSALLVDDNPVFLRAASRYLLRLQHIDSLVCVSTAPEALSHVAQHRPDLVLMDMALTRTSPDSLSASIHCNWEPDSANLNGLQLTRRIKSGSAPPVVIIVTGRDDAETRLAARQARADGLVGKHEFCQQIPVVLDRMIGNRERDASCSAPGAGCGCRAGPQPCDCRGVSLQEAGCQESPQPTAHGEGGRGSPLTPLLPLPPGPGAEQQNLSTTDCG